MTSYARYIILLVVLHLTLPNLQSQNFATLKVNTKKVYKQQPVKATITVYTSTWFTDSPDLGNVAIPNAFVIPFKRTISGIQYVNNAKYATLEFFYLIFPLEAGQLAIPELSIEVSTPAEGQYKGVRRQLKTKALSIQVLAAPSNFKGSEWLVAKDAYISDTWNSDLNELKVGDVIERTITTRALGTLPAFIPATTITQPTWASIYPRQPQINDTRTKTDANGQRIEKYRYLLEKEGSFNIEPVSISWWNPYLQKQYTRSTKPLSVIVQPNPDLNMLTTMRDSLQTAAVPVATTEADTPLLIFGMSPKKLTLLLLAVILVVWLLTKSWKKFVSYIQRQRKIYLNSDTYLYHQLIKAHSKSSKEQLNTLYWFLFRKKRHYTTDPSNEWAQTLLKSVFLNKEKKLSKRELKALCEKYKETADKVSKTIPPLNP
ncbi:BatD family protein [Carboxylicivirga taeanensis]|uniref:BatD family protein n=1 Tax=Carboxylicivirga taeanensis TaxID=1416875 RepID=UPI003F6DDEE7